MSKDTDIARDGRRDRLVQERIHDPYKPRGQLPEPSRCTECGVVYAQGRWQWQSEPPAGAQTLVCPACRRIRDRVPASLLTLSGPFFDAHRDEILRLVHNKVDEQQRDHPMKRVMGMEEEDGELVIAFTDVHLPRGVGTAIQRAYEGELDIKFAGAGETMRASWHR